MALLLRGTDLFQALPYADAVAVIESAFRAFASGSYVMPQRLVMQTDEGTLAAMPAAGNGTYGVKIATVHGGNPSRGLPSIRALVVLMGAARGEVQAIMDGAALTVLRTAAASAVATRALANPERADLGVLGAGAQAIGHVRALAATVPVRRVLLYSPRLEERWGLVSSQLRDISIEVGRAGSAREAVERSNLIVLATTSPTPILSWEWIQPGTHINAVGSHSPAARELDTETVTRSQLVCDFAQACWAEAGDLLLAHAEGAIEADGFPSLGDVLLHPPSIRRARHEVTVFKSVGLAFQDLAAATAVVKRASALGLGTMWEPD